MKKKLISLLIINLFINSTYTMNINNDNSSNPTALLEGITNFAEGVTRDIARSLEEAQHMKALEKQIKKEELEHKIRTASNQRQAELYTHQLETLYSQETKEEEEYRNLRNSCNQAGIQLVTQGIQTAFNMVHEEQRSEHELRRAAATAHINAREQSATQLESLNRKLAFFSNPHNIKILSLGVAGTAAGIYSAKHGSHLLADMIRHYYRNPSIAQETSLLSFAEKIQNFVLGKKTASHNIKDVVLKPDLKQSIELLAQSIKDALNHGGYFQNILFYGPPGTGKTMVAQRLARSCGLEYIYFAASSLLQLSTEEALIKVTELFEFAKKSNNKLMIIIDEAEKLFAHRRKNLDDKTRNLLTQILTYTGTESQDYLVVGLTNLPEELDPAFLSRCDKKIHISSPELIERKKILEKYIKDYLLTPLIRASRSQTIFTKALNYFKKPTPLVKLSIEKDSLDTTTIQSIAEKTTGFVGRDLAKLVLEIQKRALINNKKITKQLVDKVVSEYIDQYNRTVNGFHHEFAGI